MNIPEIAARGNRAKVSLGAGLWQQTAAQAATNLGLLKSMEIYEMS